MSFLMPSTKPPQAQQQPAAAGVTIQTSCYGKIIPVVIGTAKVSPNLLDYGNFTSATTTSGGGGGGGGGKGGGGGDSGGGTSTTTYSAMFVFGLCEGPISGVGTVWSAKTETDAPTLGLTVFDGTQAQAPWGYLAGQTVVQELHTIPVTAPYQVTVDWPGAPVTDQGVVDAQTGDAFVIGGTGPLAMQYTVSGGTYTFAAAQAGVDVTISYTSANQQPPSRGLSYSFMAYAASSAFNLGSSPNSPNNNFEVQGFYCTTITASPGDADPSLFVGGLLTDPRWGIGSLFPAWGLGALTQYQAYTLATGLVISACYSEQQTAAQALSDLATYTNADICTTDSITLIPRCDTAVTANGASFTPPASVFNFTDDDWLLVNAAATATGTAAADPLVVNRARPDTITNQVTLEFLNRANQYSPETVTARDVAAIRRYGVRTDKTQQAHMFATGTSARISAQLLLQKAAAANQWQGTVGEQAIAVDIGDRGWISSAVQGVAARYVKVVEIPEQSDFSLAMTFEDVLTGAGVSAIHTFATAQGTAPNYNVDPGDAVTPILFEPPVELTSGLELWLATAGLPPWGGCQVWMATGDDATYKLAGTVNGSCRMGVLSAALTAGADPDTTDTLAVDLTESEGTLIGATQAEADAFVTLCWVDGELISYQSATLTATNKYALGYLRRGVYGTTNGAHAIGANFLRLGDACILKLPYSKDQIGQTVSVKLVSHNIYGGGGQDIAEVPSTSYTLIGPPLPPPPTGVSAQQVGNVVNIAWDSSPDFAMDIAVGPQGCASGVSVAQAWSVMSMVTEAARGSYDANASIQPGSYTCGFRQRNTYSDQLSAGMVTVDLVVANAQAVIATDQQAPAWIGTLTGFIRHYTGVLIPDSTPLANQVTQAEAAAGFIPGAMATSTYDSPVIDTGAVDQIRMWATIAAQLGPSGLGNVNTSLLVDWSSDNITWQGVWRPWSVGTVTARYARFRLLQDNSAGACVVTGFVPTADVSTKTDIGTGTAWASPVTVASGGTAITFSQPFHVIPNVQTTAMGVGMTGATAINVTTTGCTLHGWTGSTDSGGAVSWKATGP